MTDSVVEIAGLLQRRTHFELGPVELSIPKGCVTAIIGPNGSGKSSLFRLMLGLSKPDEGSLHLLGERLGERDDASLMTRIGYLPEGAIELDDRLSGEAKAAFVRQWYPGWNEAVYRELLRRFEINPALKLGRMSKGMRRKYDLSLALAHQPELLLLDEPSSGLDPIAWKTMIDVLHRYMERGDRTIVMASHIVEEVRRLADYIVFIVQGRILGIYEKDALLASWQTMYADAGGRDLAWQQMPGYRSGEMSGGTVYKVVTDQAFEAERWLDAQSVTVINRQKLELDEILVQLTEQARGVL
ncbi:ABC transporter ATP-binding protein [Paenibacillus sacheonensis]|uniref:ATP-binding cassette domain-containing protein n=1 Tax=Paenibacillus sacheonensis TaxID=742054 RepID=A0A7X5BXP1_9BACL|nr:ABC transporter ATP-binding protein [Paenibacillus sacheonensis]MBM7566080.1 ABC-2 type transport system ATP-binding protein [Paenibacillus sacheonensis]NBC68611.1 ATP-binding cassette domain-containing protein [Paenibacillus sacheonensis]